MFPLIGWTALILAGLQAGLNWGSQRSAKGERKQARKLDQVRRREELKSSMQADVEDRTLTRDLSAEDIAARDRARREEIEASERARADYLASTNAYNQMVFGQRQPFYAAGQAAHGRVADLLGLGGMGAPGGGGMPPGLQPGAGAGAMPPGGAPPPPPVAAAPATSRRAPVRSAARGRYVRGPSSAAMPPPPGAPGGPKWQEIMTMAAMFDGADRGPAPRPPAGIGSATRGWG